MIVFQTADLIGKAEGGGDFHLVVVHVGPVAAFPLSFPELGHGHGLAVGDLRHIVQDALLIAELRGLKFAVLFAAEPERDAGVDHRLTLENVEKEFLGDIDIGKHLQIRQPAEFGAGLFAAVGGLFHLPGNFALFKVELVLKAVPMDDGVEPLGGVLGGAGAQAVETQGVFIVAAGVVLVLAAGVQLTEHQLPVILLFGFVPVHGAAAAEVLHLNGVVGVAGDNDRIAVALSGLVDGVGQDFKNGVFAALQAVGAKNNGRTLAHPVSAL